MEQGEDRVGLWRHHGAWSTDPATLPWLSVCCCLLQSAGSPSPLPHYFLCFPEVSKYTVSSVSSLNRFITGWVKAGVGPGELACPAELGPVFLPQSLPSVSAATLGCLGLALAEHPLWGWVRLCGDGKWWGSSCFKVPVPSPYAAANCGGEPCATLLQFCSSGWRSSLPCCAIKGLLWFSSCCLHLFLGSLSCFASKGKV